MAVIPTGQEDAALDGGEFGKLVFHWHGDRYQHRWLCGDTGQALLESIESDHAIAWPSSPPLQQVYRQSFDDGREVMFGIGMSGRGHWSVSFTLVPELSCWIVELACCSPTLPEQLCSTYRLHSHWLWKTTEPNRPELYCQSGSSQLHLQPLGESTRLSPRALPDVQQESLTIPAELRIEPATIDPDGSTTQWGFRLRVATTSARVMP